MFVHSKESVLVTYSVTDKTSRMPAKSIQEPCFSVRVCVCVCVCVLVAEIKSNFLLKLRNIAVVGHTCCLCCVA